MNEPNGTPRPSVVAVVACHDGGPCDPDPTSYCPHCGAPGRYIFRCIMSDGSTKGMMKGCLATFKRDACAIQCEKALAKAKAKRKSRWDTQVINAIEQFTAGTLTIEGLRSVCQSVAFQKQIWIKNKFYR